MGETMWLLSCVCASFRWRGGAGELVASDIGLGYGCGYPSLWVVLYDAVELLRIMCRDNMSLCGVVLVAVR